MTAKLKAAYDWVMSQDWYTWVGHGLLGALLYLLFRSFAVVFVAFLYREVSDLLNWWRDDRDVWTGRGPIPATRKPPFQHKLKDGFLDFYAPMVGAVLVKVVLTITQGA